MQSSRDMLSNLPLGVIHTILERVPITDAVRTCILSREWRDKWASLPHLTFDAQSLTSSNNFIYQVLLLHQGPIPKFKLNFSRKTISQNLNPWLTFLSRNGIRVLILRCSGVGSVILTSLYSCQKLTHLEIFNCEFLPPPLTFKGFLCLRRLVLEYVCLSSHTIQSLLSDLNLLEELRLLKVYGWERDLDLGIHLPNLKTLHLDGVFQDICLYAPLLIHMCVNFTKPPHIKNSECTYTKLLGSLTSLEELKGDPYFFEFLSIGIESCHTPLVFPHLRLIELSPEMFYEKKVESLISHLCNGAPNLQKIRVTYMHYCHSRLPSLSGDSECPFNCTFERLEVVEFDYPYFAYKADNINHWMKLIKCLLARSPALETLICVRPGASDSELLEQASTLLTYPRASPNVKIVFRKR